MAVAVCAGSFAASAQTRTPRLPSGSDPGGPAVALVSTGVDYTDPALAKMLARDGEGELIGWDFVDGDNRPFDEANGTSPAAHGGNATEIAKRIGLRIVPIRVDPTHPAHLANALVFAARTPARIVLVPMWSHSRQQWEPFQQMAENAKRTLLLIVAAGDDGVDIDKDPVWPAAFALENSLIVNIAAQGDRGMAIVGNHAADNTYLSLATFPIDPVPGDTKGRPLLVRAPDPSLTSTRLAAADVAWAAACNTGDPNLPTVEALRNAMFARTRPSPADPGIRLYQPECWASRPTGQVPPPPLSGRRGERRR
jgi:hypothetical protein